MSEMPVSVEIFCSYAYKDEVWWKKLEMHLSLLKRQGLISLWHHRLITPGANQTESIDTRLETASVILLLVSAYFLASDYCYGVEMERALKRHEAGEVLVIPILVRPVDLKDSPFAHLRSLPTDGKPITAWRMQDRALVDVATGIRRAIEDMSLLAASVPHAALPKIWTIPYPRNPFFLGRETELALVRQHLQAGQAVAFSQPQAISGLGGIGKSQIALEYAYRYHQDYQAVFWARAESTRALVSSYVAIARELRLPEHEEKEQEIIIQAVRQWLQTHRGWLLILDNADELALLPDFLPSTSGGHLLLTTRAAATEGLARQLEMKTFQPEQGALLLLRRSGLVAPEVELSQISARERDMALRISQELGGLPLALDQAGAYLEATGTNLADYWQIYQQHRAVLLQKRGSLLLDHPAPVATTWLLSFERVKKKNPAAADLLRLCAFLAPDAIPEEILSAGASSLGPVLAPVAANLFLLNQAIEELRAYSLVRRDPQEKSLSIHRLVQVVLMDWLLEEERHTWQERAIQAVSAVFPRAEYSIWAKCERLLPQALQVARNIETDHVVSMGAGRLLHNAAFYLYERARYQEAESLYLRALDGEEQRLEPDYLEITDLSHELGLLYVRQARYTRSEQFLKKALDSGEQTLEPDHPRMANLLEGLGFLYFEQGRFPEAEPFHSRALRIREQQLEPDYPEMIRSLSNLANLYRAQGRYAEAEPLLQRALCSAEQTLRPDHPEMAHLPHGLAFLYFQQERYAEAEPLFQRALCSAEQTFGSDHPEMAYHLNGLGHLYVRQERYAEAEPLFQRAVCIRAQKLGLEHPQMLYPLSGLAFLYFRQGKYVEAKSLDEHIQRIKAQKSGADRPNITGTRKDLITLFHTIGLHEQAAQLEAVQSEP